MQVEYYLGANTPQGFASYYDEWLDLERLNRLFILKGSPGNGKSSFMKRIAAKLGPPYETVLCSGDARSWDGVYFPHLGVAFVDGTLPHVWSANTYQ